MAHEKKAKHRKEFNSIKKPDTADMKPSTAFDPTLSSLFASSLGPTKKSSKTAAPTITNDGDVLASGTLDLISEQRSASEPALGDQAVVGRVNDISHESSDRNLVPAPPSPEIRRKKRKHRGDDVEGMYMLKLAREEAKEDAQRHKKQKLNEIPLPHPSDETSSDGETRSESGSVKIVTGDERETSPADVPQHESLGPTKAELDLQKASRTVFLGNVSNKAIKSKSARKALLDHLASFLPSLPEHETQKVESLRYRSTAFSSSAVPKKAAFAKKELMDSTTQSTNAYAVYSTQLAAREAIKKLNGTVVLDRHLRVDSVAHPAKADHRRCVFVGNLGFVDDESAEKAAEDEANGKRPRKGKEPADLEEGLWRQFGKAGVIESVRVPRDKSTRVGKGFAYVQFEDPNGVEKALLFDGKKFPPLLPRILRVTRAKNIKKTNNQTNPAKRSTRDDRPGAALGRHRPKISSEVQSMAGRAGKLFGRAGAAQSHVDGDKAAKLAGIHKSPEAIVFEGYRASNKQGKGTLKLGGAGKKQGKPRTRSSKRGAAFKAAGRKK